MVNLMDEVFVVVVGHHDREPYMNVFVFLSEEEAREFYVTQNITNLNSIHVFKEKIR